MGGALRSGSWVGRALDGRGLGGRTLGGWALGQTFSSLDCARRALWLALTAGCVILCGSSLSEVLYVFGGFDGAGELGDFWKFDVRSSSWIQICSDAGLVVSLPRAVV